MLVFYLPEATTKTFSTTNKTSNLPEDNPTDQLLIATLRRYLETSFKSTILAKTSVAFTNFRHFGEYWVIVRVELTHDKAKM